MCGYREHRPLRGLGVSVCGWGPKKSASCVWLELIQAAFGPGLAPLSPQTYTHQKRLQRSRQEFALAAYQAEVKSITCINKGSGPGQYPPRLQPDSTTPNTFQHFKSLGCQSTGLAPRGDANFLHVSKPTENEILAWHCKSCCIVAPFHF